MLTHKCTLSFIILVSLSLLTSITRAQLPPDAGQFFRVLSSPSNDARWSLISPIEENENLKAESSSSEAVIYVSEFIYKGNTAFTDADLDELTFAFTNREIRFAEILEAVKAAESLYQEKGLLARVFVPEQQVVDGKIEIRFVEGRFGKLRLRRLASQSPLMDRVEKILAKYQPKDEIVNTVAIEKAMLVANSLPGIRVVGSYIAGTDEGETDLELEILQESPLRGNITLDNTASEFTGVSQAGMALSLNAPLLFAGSIDLSAAKSEGISFARAGYQGYIGYSGFRYSVYSSAFEYNVIADDFSALKLTGGSRSTGINLSYPHKLSSNFDFTSQLTLQTNDFFNSAFGAENTRYDVASITYSPRVLFRDRIGRGGISRVEFQFSVGELSNSLVDGVFQNSPKARFKKVRYHFSREYPISQKYYFDLSLNGQYTKDVLDSSERYFIGGIGGVRALSVNEGSGDNAAVLRAELLHRYNQNLSFSGFFDLGRFVSRRNISSSSKGSIEENGNFSGLGVSLNFENSRGIKASATASSIMEQTPRFSTNAQVDGAPSKQMQVWLQLAIPFALR